MRVLQHPVEMADGLYLVYHEFPHRNSGNVYLVTASGGSHKGVTTLIDCGSESSFDQTQKNIRELGFRLSDIDQVIATHGDFDHVQGFHRLASKVSKVPLLIHKADWLSVIEGDQIHTKACVYGLPFKPLPVDRCIPLSGNQLITIGDSEWVYVHTPGHSEGSISLLGEIDGQRWLIAGDAYRGGEIDSEFIGDQTAKEYKQMWRASLASLSQLEFDWVLTGHEPDKLERAVFDRDVKYFSRMNYPWFSLEEPLPEGVNTESEQIELKPADQTSQAAD